MAEAAANSINDDSSTSLDSSTFVKRVPLHQKSGIYYSETFSLVEYQP